MTKVLDVEPGGPLRFRASGGFFEPEESEEVPVDKKRKVKKDELIDRVMVLESSFAKMIDRMVFKDKEIADLKRRIEDLECRPVVQTGIVIPSIPLGPITCGGASGINRCGGCGKDISGEPYHCCTTCTTVEAGNTYLR